MSSLIRNERGALELRQYDVVDERFGTIASGLTMGEARKLADEDRSYRRVVWRKPL